MLDDFPVVVEVPVAWGEMDAFQHVNNTVYLRYFETARIAYLEEIGYTQMMKEVAKGPILHSTQCRFRFPLTYPDTVKIGARTKRVDEDRFLMEYCVMSTRHNKVAAEGEGLLVSFDYKTGSKIPLPEEIRKGIAAVEK